MQFFGYNQFLKLMGCGFRGAADIRSDVKYVFTCLKNKTALVAGYSCIVK